MKVLFLGTPAFAVPTLKALLSSKHTVVGVITQPDRALKRGKTDVCPVKAAALDAGLKVFQPEKIRNCVDEVKSFGADIAVTAAYGQILSREVLDIFPFGVINVHASLLPKYRGASPIQSAIAAGECETGVTIMRTELAMDTGDILAAGSTLIDDVENYGALSDRLAVLGAKLLVDTLDNYDSIVPVPQDNSLATYCRLIKKADEYINFGTDCLSVVNRIRALSPSPCAKTIIGGEIYKIYSALPVEAKGAPGEIVECDKRLVIACASGGIEVLNIQAPGKRALDTGDFLRGKKFPTGVICELRQE